MKYSQKKFIILFLGLLCFLLTLFCVNLKKHRSIDDVFLFASNGDIEALKRYCKEEYFYIKNDWGRTPVFYAKNPETLDFFIQQGIDVNQCVDNEGVSLLEHFCMTDKTDNIKKILPYVKNINSQDVEGGTALVWAIIRGNFQIVKLLLLNGADPNLKLSNGMNAIDVAKKNINKKQNIIDLLKEKIND